MSLKKKGGRYGASLLVLSVLSLPVRLSAGADTKASSKQKAAAGTKVAPQKSSSSASKKAHATRRPRRSSYRYRLARLRMEPERVREIQQALAKQGYFSGEPNGKWDDPTRQAMRHYQEAHGFSATGMPDARSLMKLGLGPHPLPPESDPLASSGATAQAPSESDPPKQDKNDPPRM